MKLTGIPVKGARVDKKTGKLKTFAKLDASAKIRQRKSKKVRVAKPGATKP